MIRTAKRTPHTCHYGQPCAACAASTGARVDAATQATIRTAMERTRTYRAQEAIESIKLERWAKDADGYGPNGEPRYLTRRGYVNAGRRRGMEWQ